MCVCPQPAGVNGSKSNGMVFNYPVPPEHCNCEYVVLPHLQFDIKGNEFCPRCECKYESRNTTTIKVVVILVTWILSLLVVYMGFLLCLEPLLKRRNVYQHQTNEEDLPCDQDAPHGEPPHPLRPRPHDVLGRVGHHQDRWKRQVLEQRRNIYDRHSMLN